jgi:hypothetical protein
MSPTEAEKLAQHLALLRKSAKDITLFLQKDTYGTYNTVLAREQKRHNYRKKQCCGSGSASFW